MESHLQPKASLLQKIFGLIANRFPIFLSLQVAVLISMNLLTTGCIPTWFGWTDQLYLTEKILPFLKQWQKKDLLSCFGWVMRGIPEMLIIIVSGGYGTGHIMTGQHVCCRTF